MRKFWDFAGEGEARTLYLEGVIADESWFGDEVTPAEFKTELNKGSGDITVFINSPGGGVFAAAEIYTALREYPGKVTVKISALAASAASVVAMSGDTVLMSPVACLMIHNPSTVAFGDAGEMARAKAMLDQVKQTIINAYTLKSGQPRELISEMMDAETWIYAQDAVKLGFADAMLYDESRVPSSRLKNMIYTRQAVSASFMSRIHSKPAQREPQPGAVRNVKVRDSIISKQIYGGIHSK